MRSPSQPTLGNSKSSLRRNGRTWAIFSLHLIPLIKMWGNDFQKFVKGWSVNPKHPLECTWIKVIHLFYSKAPVAMEIPRLPSNFCWPLLMLTEIAGNEALLPSPSAGTSQNCSKNSSIWDTSTIAGCHRHQTSKGKYWKIAALQQPQQSQYTHANRERDLWGLPLCTGRSCVIHKNLRNEKRQ